MGNTTARARETTPPRLARASLALALLGLAASLLCGLARAGADERPPAAIAGSVAEKASPARAPASPQPAERSRPLPRQLRQFLPEVGPRPAPKRATA